MFYLGGYAGGGGGGSYSAGLNSHFVQGGSSDVHGSLRVSRIDIGAEDVLMMSCGQEGWRGPTQNQCQEAYPQDLYISLAHGIQEIRIPSDGEWEIAAYGALGGDVALSARSTLKEEDTGAFGGHGAIVKSKVTLKANDYIQIAIGQPGQNARNVDLSTLKDMGGAGGGGGGGTFIWKRGSSKPLVVAGGGGGGYISTTYKATNGKHGMQGPDGSHGMVGGAGGKDGKGGVAPGDNDRGSAGGGGGWISSGDCRNSRAGVCGMGKEFYFKGGAAMTGSHVQGGFGGGGGAGVQAGGGGGYSGGGGGKGGGGGGSYSADPNADIKAGGNFMFGSGMVILKRPCPKGETMRLGACVALDACKIYPCDKNAECVGKNALALRFFVDRILNDRY